MDKSKTKTKGEGPEELERAGLESLPHETFLRVAKNLETTRDLLALAQTSKKVNHSVMSSLTWQDFVKTKFPDRNIPRKNGPHDWKGIAEALTYQTRCFDRRSLRFTAMYPARRQQRRRGLDYQPIVDVNFDMDSGLETLIWGAGEDIMVRYRQQGRPQQNGVEWRQIFGNHTGLRAGRDDIRTMNIVKLPHLKAPAMLVGRDNGDLSLLSARNDRNWGRQLANFSPDHANRPIQGTFPNKDLPLKQQMVYAADVFNDRTSGNAISLVACTNLGASIYRLPQDSNTSCIAPDAICDHSEQTDQKIWNAKWMGSNKLLALALRGTDHPLRLMSVTPTGLEVYAAAKNNRVHEVFELNDVSILVNSLQPVSRFPGTADKSTLLLSSWKDGTIRLQDIRTPSPFDTVFQDNINPWRESDSLMTYGADRFVAGSMDASLISTFDFRMPKSYYHTTALECGSQYPYPQVYQPFIKRPPPDPTRGRDRCAPFPRNNNNNFRCRYHELSRQIYHRPNAMYMLSSSLPDHLGASRVSNLVKASDISSNYYVGITGAVVEVNLGSNLSTTAHEPNFGFPDYDAAKQPPNFGQIGHGGYATCPVTPSVMEIGDGLRNPRNVDHNVRMPGVHSHDRKVANFPVEVPARLTEKHRLDESFQLYEDYWQEKEGFDMLFHRLGVV
ncbi:hypothetical protein GE09DRAFT_947631 [Coniochaeta sp. 2T2.1]|nr:hypothetical protein GE09DRAFT_947631 [Coniochaeta sp. 2T2.1]